MNKTVVAVVAIIALAATLIVGMILLRSRPFPRYMVTGGTLSGYLLDTDTGEVWYLQHDEKRKVYEVHDIVGSAARKKYGTAH